MSSRYLRAANRNSLGLVARRLNVRERKDLGTSGTAEARGITMENKSEAREGDAVGGERGTVNAKEKQHWLGRKWMADQSDLG